MGSANKGKGLRAKWLFDNVGYDEEDCLIWPGPTDPIRGYGQMGYEGPLHRGTGAADKANAQIRESQNGRQSIQRDLQFYLQDKVRRNVPLGVGSAFLSHKTKRSPSEYCRQAESTKSDPSHLDGCRQTYSQKHSLQHMTLPAHFSYQLFAQAPAQQ